METLLILLLKFSRWNRQLAKLETNLVEKILQITNWSSFLGSLVSYKVEACGLVEREWNPSIDPSCLNDVEVIEVVHSYFR